MIEKDIVDIKHYLRSMCYLRLKRMDVEAAITLWDVTDTRTTTQTMNIMRKYARASKISVYRELCYVWKFNISILIVMTGKNYYV